MWKRSQSWDTNPVFLSGSRALSQAAWSDWWQLCCDQQLHFLRTQRELCKVLQTFTRGTGIYEKVTAFCLHMGMWVNWHPTHSQCLNLNSNVSIPCVYYKKSVHGCVMIARKGYKFSTEWSNKHWKSLIGSHEFVLLRSPFSSLQDYETRLFGCQQWDALRAPIWS